MFGLRKEIGGNETRVGKTVGEDENLTGSGHHIDAHGACHDFFGQGDIQVAGTDDDVHLRNCFGSICESRNSPGAADLVDLTHAHLTGRHEKMRVDATVTGRGSDHDDPLHTGDSCRDRTHQDRRDQRCGAPSAAGNVNPRGLHRVDHLADQSPRSIGIDPGFRQLEPVKRFDLRGRTIQRPSEGGIHLSGRLPELRLGNRQRPRLQAGGIESVDVFYQGSVTVSADILQNTVHS